MTKEQAIRLLSSETFIEEITQIEYYAGFDKSKALKAFEESCNMGADALRNQTWISVDYMLPENAERYKGRKVIDVLVTTDRGKVTKVQRISNEGYWYWGRIFSNIIAWMPLPNKYISEE